MNRWRNFAWWIIAGAFSVMTFGCQHMVTNSNGEQLPRLYIYAADADTLYVKCRQKIDADAILIDEKGDTLIDEPLEYIKSRGNSTFRDKAKKPFAIKFNRRKDILGLYKSKKFVLLANAFDESHIRTAIAFDLAERMGVPAPRYAYVVLYINDEYKGLYQMVNAREISKFFLDINDLDRDNKRTNLRSLDKYPQIVDTTSNGDELKGYIYDNPDDITGGYILEYTCYKREFIRKESGFRAKSGDLLTIDNPKYSSIDEVRYIQSFYNKVEEALKDTITEEYQKYIDILSFARYYLLQEFLLNVDAGWRSTFMYKDSGNSNRLCAGPLWDVDISQANPVWGGRVISANMFWVNRAFGEQYHAYSSGFFYRLWQHPSFQDTVRYVYLNEMSPVVHEYLRKRNVEALALQLQNEVQRDYKLNGNRLSDDYVDAVSILCEFLNKRVAFMDWYFSASKDNIICLTDKSTTKVLIHDKQVQLYYPKDKPFVMPMPRARYNNSHALIPEWYICGMDSLLSGEVHFAHDTDIEIRVRKPSWIEIRVRQIYALRKMIRSKVSRCI